MALFFELIDDDEIVAVHKVRPGLRVGRTQGEILLNDPKVSGLHAYVDLDTRERFVLIDNDSSNGLRVNQRRVAKVLLVRGTNIDIGRSTLRVVEIDESISRPLGDWKSEIQKNLRYAASEIKPQLISPLAPALRIQIQEGIQLGTEWILGYAPRIVGRKSLEFPVFENPAPDVCFQIESIKLGEVMFKTAHPDIVIFDGQRVESCTIRSGSEIRIGQSRFHLDFVSVDSGTDKNS